MGRGLGVTAGAVAVAANLNAPDQVVISGAAAAVEAALPLLEGAGAKMVKKLKVSGAFHSALMHEPAAEFAQLLARRTFAAAVPAARPHAWSSVEGGRCFSSPSS